MNTVQKIWQTWEIPQELGWNFLVLISKGTTGTGSIGLLGTLWKMVEALIDTRLRASLQFHYFLPGFRYVRGTGTAIMELKLAQELSSVDHKLLLLGFTDLCKSYDTMDRDRLIQTLEVYGVGPRMCGLLETF